MASLLAWTAHVAAQSRAEDPNYDPGAEARTRAQNSAAPYGAEREVTGEQQETPQPRDPADDEPYLEGEALRYQVRDIELGSWPPNPVVTLGISAVYPFEILGIGVGATGYLGDLLRLSGSIGAGFNFVGVGGSSETAFGGVVEASVGLRVLAVEGRIAADVQGTERPRPGEFEPAGHHLFNAWLPATHALVVEAGMLAGGFPRARCVDKCDQADPEQRSYLPVNPLLFYPEGGLRYVFFSSASSRIRPNVNRRWDIEAFFHLVLRPLGDTAARTVTLQEERIERSPFGGRGGVSVPLCGHRCLTLSIMAGYLPAPDTVTFSAGVSY